MSEFNEQETLDEVDAVEEIDELDSFDELLVEDDSNYEVLVDDPVDVEEVDIIEEDPIVELFADKDTTENPEVLSDDGEEGSDKLAKPLPWLPLLIALLGLAALAGALYFGLQYFGGDDFGDAARVNGQAITMKRLNAEMARIELSNPGLFDAETGGIDKNMVRSQTLDELINQELILQKAAEEGITATDEEIDQEIEGIKAQYGDAYEETLVEYGFTEQDLRDQIKYSLLLQGLIENLVPRDAITDAMVKEYYDDNVDMFKEEAGKRVSHILFDIEDKATAEEVLAQIKDGSGDFAQLAEEYSQDPGSAQSGGDLGWASSDAYVPEFKEGVDALQKDEISELVQTEYGWHIIKITDTREEGIMTLADVEEDIRAMLLNQKQNEVYSTLMTTLREDAKIEILDEDVLAYREAQGNTEIMMGTE